MTGDEFLFAEPKSKHRGPIPHGKRHRALVSYAGRLRARGLDRDEAVVLFERRWRDCEQHTREPGKCPGGEHEPTAECHPVRRWRSSTTSLHGTRQENSHNPQNPRRSMVLGIVGMYL